MFHFISQYSGVQLAIVCIAVLLSVLISLSLHEYAHAFAAYKNGDHTAKHQGRLTINPAAHMDPIGFFSAALFGFGWAKPVPVNSLNFRNYKKGMAWVSIAGVLVNLALAFIFGAVYVLIHKYWGEPTSLFGFFLYSMSSFMLFINACLFVFNLLPIYPLDGFNLLSTFLRYDNRYVLFMRQYGHFALIALLLFFSNLIANLIYLVSSPIVIFWSWIL